MVLRYTEEELALAAIFEPYLEAGKLQENAPQDFGKRQSPNS